MLPSSKTELQGVGGEGGQSTPRGEAHRCGCFLHRDRAPRFYLPAVQRYTTLLGSVVSQTASWILLEVQGVGDAWQTLARTIGDQLGQVRTKNLLGA